MDLTANTAEIAKTLAILFQSGDVAEMRVLNGYLTHGATHTTKTISGYYDTMGELVKDALELSEFAENKGMQGKFYVTMNPVQPALASGFVNKYDKAAQTAADANIAKRRWVLVDCDPERANGYKKESATDTEKEVARERAEQVRLWLDEQGWAAPVTADSGNGYHLLYAVDMANDADATKLVQTWLGCLSSKFSDDNVKIDVVVYNAARITKLYGTWAVKGTHTDERPYRLSRILDVPENVETIAASQFEAVIGAIGFPALTTPMKAAKAPKATKANLATKAPAQNFDVQAFLDAHQISYRPAEQMADGRTRWTLTNCAFDATHADKDAAVFQDAEGALGYKCFHNSCADKGWKEFRARFDASYKPIDDDDLAAMGLYDKLETFYQFRRNVVAGQIEYREVGQDKWRVAEDADYNTIKIRAKREWDEGNCKVSEIMEWADSHHTPSYHPIRDFLTSQQWDGSDQLGTLAGMVKTEDDALFAAYLKAWFVRACDQVLTGQANEYMIVLAGQQGVGKTTFARAILPPALRSDYYHAAKLEAGKDGQAVLTSKWLIVDDELVGLRKTEVESIKAMLSSTMQTYRPPYGRVPVTRPRLASFIGATNDAEFLTDPTGARRFLAIDVQSFDLSALRQWDSTQAWAQAMALYAEGERGFLSEELKAKQSTANAAKGEETACDHLVQTYVRASSDKATWANTTAVGLSIAATVTEQFSGTRIPTITPRELAKALRKAGHRQDTHGVKRWCVAVLDKHDIGMAGLLRAERMDAEASEKKEAAHNFVVAGAGSSGEQSATALDFAAWDSDLNGY